VKTIHLRGERWRVENVHALPIGDLGECNYAERTLRMPYDGDTKEELDTCIHEMLHKCLPDLSEAAVAEIATDLTHALWRLQWRKND
jgi:hypothetical protein